MSLAVVKAGVKMRDLPPNKIQPTIEAGSWREQRRVSKQARVQRAPRSGGEGQ